MGDAFAAMGAANAETLTEHGTMNAKRIFKLLPLALLCTLFAGCGRPAYLLPVKDGKGIAKGAHVFWDQGGTGAAKAVGTVTAVEKGGEGEKPVLRKA